MNTKKIQFYSYWLFLLCVPVTVYGFNWYDLWLTKDQQAVQALNNNQPTEAAKLFHSPAWQGVANYRAGNFEQAAKDFSTNENLPVNNYNRGNALAKVHKYQEALAAYNRALQQQPDFSDAKFNCDLIEKLLKQQQQKNDSENNNSSQSTNKKQQTQADKQNSSQTQQNAQTEHQKRTSASEDKNQQNRSQLEPQADASKIDQSTPSQKAQTELNKDEKQMHSSTQKVETSQLDKPNTQFFAEKSQQKKSENIEKSNSNTAGNNFSSKEQHLNRQNNNLTKTDSIEQTAQQQADQQLLQQIPDDPGGLLRQKFLRDYERNAQ